MKYLRRLNRENPLGESKVAEYRWEEGVSNSDPWDLTLDDREYLEFRDVTDRSELCVLRGGVWYANVELDVEDGS